MVKQPHSIVQWFYSAVDGQNQVSLNSKLMDFQSNFCWHTQQTPLPLDMASDFIKYGDRTSRQLITPRRL